MDFLDNVLQIYFLLDQHYDATFRQVRCSPKHVKAPPPLR